LAREQTRETFGVSLIAPALAFYNDRVTSSSQGIDGSQWVSVIQGWARALGFSQIAVAGVDLSSAEPGLSAWLDAGFHGDMHYMAAHGMKRARPMELVPGTVSVITTRMDYLPADTPGSWQGAELNRLERPTEAIVSLYARGRDYHKVMRSRLQTLSEKIAAAMGPLGYRVFTDSAPVLEAELASRSGQGWRGKHTLILNREAGSMFFLGEIFVDLTLPATEPVASHCGVCKACMDICPTQAIVAPYRLDARRCISYLTIEHVGPIPIELRTLMGNRIYGCDDCQLICPWNKFAQRSTLADFDARAGLAGNQLVTLFGWSEAEFLRYTEGTPIRRIGHERWLRNIAVALGNALRVANTRSAEELVQALRTRTEHPSALVQEHVAWALACAKIP
jgi:epoxyqueuosine reductase